MTTSGTTPRPIGDTNGDPTESESGDATPGAGDDAFASIRTLLARDHDVPPERLTRDASLETLGVDSLGIMELLWNLEDELGITLPTDRTDLHTLGEVADYIDGLVVEQRGREGSA